MIEYTRLTDGKVLTWEEALHDLLASGPTDQQVAAFIQNEQARFRRFPDQRRKAEQMIDAARPPWVRPLYLRTVEQLIAEGKKPTDALVADKIDVEPRTIRRWRHDGLLR